MVYVSEAFMEKMKIGKVIKLQSPFTTILIAETEKIRCTQPYEYRMVLILLLAGNVRERP